MDSTTDSRLESPAFGPAGRIPRKHTGEDVSPPLAWSAPQSGTRELALIVDDPDAPRGTPWVHWVVCKIAPDRRSLAEGARPDGVEGDDDFGRRGWGGPMPPAGHGVHRYRFRLYALDAPIQAEPGATKGHVLAAINYYVIGQAELVGTYERGGAAAAGLGSYD